ncbi:tRNA (guanine-N1)-methyltransferase [Phormidium tenue FACHB-886]|nr:tRNA (guanine-N1)-methyltransferase [Phormidium tenue FACHB-886]
MQDDVGWYREGKAKFQIGNAFYRLQSQLARDLGVLAAAVYRANVGSLKVLDAMAGCGVRSLRYHLESQADYLWVNDSNPDVHLVLSKNLSSTIAPNCYQLTHFDANRVFFECYNQQNFYDLVDVDAFGAPAPYVATSLWAVAIGGLLYLTSTDGRSATGHNFHGSLANYGAYARSHPAAHEQGLRLLIGTTLQLAAAKGLGIEPVFSLFNGQVYRVMVRLIAKSQLTAAHYGFLGYCRSCGNYQSIAWRQLGKITCPHDAYPLEVSGAMWLGRLHDTHYLERMIAIARQPDCIALMQLMQAEAELPPYFYTLGEIGRRGKLDIPKRSHLIKILQGWGYAASTTHVNSQAIKTNATLQTCIEAARQMTER